MADSPLHERAGAAPPTSADPTGIEPILVDGGNARRLLGDISKRKLALMVRAKEIPSVKIGRRRMFPLDGLRQYVAERTEGGR